MADAAARAAGLAEAAAAGDRLALARLLTAVENRSPVAEAAMRALYPRAGRAHLVGITAILAVISIWVAARTFSRANA